MTHKLKLNVSLITHLKKLQPKGWFSIQTNQSFSST